VPAPPAFRPADERRAPDPPNLHDWRGDFASPTSPPASDRASATALALPIFGELTRDQQQHVVSSIADFFAGSATDR
jgi:dTDP-4-amino-4,6-dideoxygalactose transaminase